MGFDSKDYYFKQAKHEGYIARSVYKLKEIDQKYGLIQPQTKHVLDIGAAPGSRSQYILRHSFADDLQLFAIDRTNLTRSDNALRFFHGDATDDVAIQARLQKFSVKKFDIIVSDMAPNTMGQSDIDSIRSMNLIEQTLYLYDDYLAPDGKVMIKIFMGPGFEEFINTIKALLGTKSWKVVRPKAIRKQSKECYLVKYA